MTINKYSVSMTGDVHSQLVEHLKRGDGQEDLCFALWRPSTGARRTTGLVTRAVLPRDGERQVHGNASFEAQYVMRATELARDEACGLAFLHAHPSGRDWQGLSHADFRAESSIANRARELTGLPLLGMTLGGLLESWSGRFWDEGVGKDVHPTWAESVRVIGPRLLVTFNDDLVPIPRTQETQVRTIHSWGDTVQARFARLRILVIGAGSVGMLIIEALARMGIQHVGVMDFDSVELVNLDRLHGARAMDAYLHRSKIEIARRVIANAATADRKTPEFWDDSICEARGLERALDFDVIFSCVDRPWPRHVLNTIAYSDEIPVVDAGLRLEPGQNGGLRNAYWRSQVVAPGRPCLVCLGQYDPGDVQTERDGSLDNPSYIASLPEGSPLRARQNVAGLSLAAASAQLNQFLSLVVAPSGMGDPGPQRFSLASHRLEHLDVSCRSGCPYSESVGDGDGRLDPAGHHVAAENARRERDASRRRPLSRLTRTADDFLERGKTRLEKMLRPRLRPS